MRVVGTLTTLPDRYDKLKATLQSIYNQSYKLDVIYLSLPLYAKRLGKSYPILPLDIQELCTVVRCQDYGPITKLMGPLMVETDPETLIISFDDDHDYPLDLVRDLVIAHTKQPNGVICSTGALIGMAYPFHALRINTNDHLLNWLATYKVPETGRAIDIIYGFSGVLYKRGYFPTCEKLYDKLLIYADRNNDLFRNDDVLISAYLSSVDINRYIMPGIARVPSCLYVKTGDEISYSMHKFWLSYNNAIKTSIRCGLLKNTCPVSISETVGFNIFLLIVIIILTIVSIYLIWYLSRYDS